MRRLDADLLLLLAAFIWGTAFVAQKHANAGMGPLAFVGARFFLSSIVVAPLALRERKSRSKPLNTGDWAIACLVGFCLFAASTLQQIGLASTTAANGGLLTAVYVILVPFFVWIITGNRPRRIVLFAGALSMAGAWLLGGDGQSPNWPSGDAYVLTADLAWAAGISLIPIFLSRTQRPFLLAFLQSGIAALLGLMGGWSFESLTGDGLALAFPAVLYAGVCSGGIGFTIQIYAQKYTPPAEAALIMSLESVFAATAGAVFLSERLTQSALLGCILILLGVLLVEAGPAARAPEFRRRWRRTF